MIEKEKVYEFLVVEDNNGDFLLISEFLEDEFINPKINQALTYSEAQLFLEKNKDVDAVLLDLTLPDKSGEELIHHFMKTNEMLPVIVLTGYTNKDFAVKSLSLGVSDYLLKDELNSISLFKSITYSIQRKKIDKKIRESEEKFRNLFDLSPVPKLVFDKKTLRILDINQSAIKNYGYSKSEFLSMTIDNIVVDSETEDLLNWVNNPSEPEVIKKVWKHKKKNGSKIIVNFKTSNIEFDGRSACMAILEDITEKIKAEEQLKKSEQRFKALVQNGTDIISILDSDANYIYVSPTSHAVLGINPDDIVGSNAFLFIHEEDITKVLHQFARLKHEKEIHLDPYRFKDADGNYRWVESTFTNLIDEPSVGGIVANSKDVTERIEYLANLKYLSDLNEKIIAVSDDLFYVIEFSDENGFNQKLIFISPQVERFYGVTPEEYKNNPNIWMDSIHPDDKDIVVAQSKKLLTRKKPITRTYRIKNAKTGKYLWIEDNSTPVVSEEGRMLEIYGSAKDINERKMTEVLITRASIESEERERGRLSREMHDGVGQSLAALNMYMNVLGSKLGKSKNDYTAIFTSIRDLLLRTIDETRRVSHDLMPSELKEFSLFDCVKDMMERLNKIDNIKYSIRLIGKEVELESMIKVNLYRIVQEFIKNSQKYAKASKVEMILTFAESEVSILLSDNGKGFDMKKKKKEGIGILNMIHRINSLGGNYEFVTSPGKGVILKIKVSII